MKGNDFEHAMNCTMMKAENMTGAVMMQGEVIQALNGDDTGNHVYLFQSKRHGMIIKKEFGTQTHFRRAVEALKAIDRSIHPAVVKIDMRQRHLYTSYDPMKTPPASMDDCMADLLKRLHTSTKRYGVASDPGTGRVFSSWKDYLEKEGARWLDTVSNVKDFSKGFEERIHTLSGSAFSPVSYIHGNIGPNQIGERKGRYILFGFGHAIVGDPYWDVATYALLSAQSEETFYDRYGVEDRELIEQYVWFSALRRTAHFITQGRTNHADFERCMAILNEK